MYLIKFKSGQTYLSKAFSDTGRWLHSNAFKMYFCVWFCSIEIYDSCNGGFYFCIFTKVNIL